MENRNLYKKKYDSSQQQGGESKARKELKQLKSKFVNLLMRDGEKSKASKLFELSLNDLPSKEKPFKTLSLEKREFKEKKGKKGKKAKVEEKTILKDYNQFLKNNVLYQAIENVKPTLELRRVKKGGTTYQVPAIVNRKRQMMLAIKWIIESAEKRKRRNKESFSFCLGKEIVEAFNKTGQPRQKRDDLLKIAESNRAYTLYRWW